MIDTDPEDGDLAQARHRVRLLEKQVRGLQARLDAQTRSASFLAAAGAKHEQDRQLALRLRDDAAREHEQERILQQEIQGDLDEARAQLAEMREREGKIQEAVNTILGKQHVLKARVAHIRRWVDDPNVRPGESCEAIEKAISEWHESLVAARSAALSSSPAVEQEEHVATSSI